MRQKWREWSHSFSLSSQTTMTLKLKLLLNIEWMWKVEKNSYFLFLHFLRGEKWRKERKKKKLHRLCKGKIHFHDIRYIYSILCSICKVYMYIYLRKKRLKRLLRIATVTTTWEQHAYNIFMKYPTQKTHR